MKCLNCFAYETAPFVFMQSNDFYLMGKLIAMSIVQENYGFTGLHPAAYRYLTTGKYLGQIVNDHDVPSLQIRQLLEKVCGYSARFKKSRH